MLTRLEVDGFKNLLDFSIDFGPFTCIAGANGVGKSNIFDAIRFLSLLADRTLMEAAFSVRSAPDRNGSKPEDYIDIRDLFWRGKSGSRDHFTMAVEMIVPRTVFDDFGRKAEATTTFLRYEIAIGYEAASHDAISDRLVLLSEKLDYITQGDAAAHLGFFSK